MPTQDKARGSVSTDCTHSDRAALQGRAQGNHTVHPVSAAGWALLLLQLHPAAVGTALLLEQILPLVPELQEEVRRLRNASDCERPTPGITPCLP